MTEAVDVLIRALNDNRPLVRGHAAWALGEVLGAAPMAGAVRGDQQTGRNGSREPSLALRARLKVEDDGWVREECELALSESG